MDIEKMGILEVAIFPAPKLGTCEGRWKDWRRLGLRQRKWVGWKVSLLYWAYMMKAIFASRCVSRAHPVHSWAFVPPAWNISFGTVFRSHLVWVICGSGSHWLRVYYSWNHKVTTVRRPFKKKKCNSRPYWFGRLEIRPQVLILKSSDITAMQGWKPWSDSRCEHFVKSVRWLLVIE